VVFKTPSGYQFRAISLDLFPVSPERGQGIVVKRVEMIGERFKLFGRTFTFDLCEDLG
jgi:hypothetical protein